MTLMINACQRQSTKNISKYDFLHRMTTITRLVILLLIDQIVTGTFSQY
jgi:hypothetical protein